MTDDTCIWCAKQPGRSLEHIVPDALGCPPEFVLTQGVCADCNHRNGKLDRALLTPFEIQTVINGVPRKGGRKPTVDGFRSFSSGYDANGLTIFMNRERHPVQLPNGKWLQGTYSDDPIFDASIEPQPDGTARVKFSYQMRFDRKSVRCLFKICVESIAFFEGFEAARDPIFNPIKHFVLEGGGNYKAAMQPSSNSPHELYITPMFSEKELHRSCHISLHGVDILCDFHPKFLNGKQFVEDVKTASSAAVQVIPNWPRDLWVKNNL